MQAIEFNAAIQNGCLQVPRQFNHWQNKVVKVILLEESPEEIFRSRSTSPSQGSEALFHLLTELSDDFMSEGRVQLPLQHRESL
jgi:hypothetical protein